MEELIQKPQSQLSQSYLSKIEILEQKVKQEISTKECPQARIYQLKLEEITFFKDPAKMKKKGEMLLMKEPEFERLANNLINTYFSKKDSVIDIVFLLHSGLLASHLISPYFDSNNLIFYRPISPNSEINVPYLIGTPKIENELLFVENDMLSGSTLKKSIDFFQELGYTREKMNVFLYAGAHRKRNQFNGKFYVPELGQVDKILDRSNDSSNSSKKPLRLKSMDLFRNLSKLIKI